jgi:hypothetical protein
VHETVTHPHPIAKYCCYKLCLVRGWDDLIEYAIRDLDNDLWVPLPNQSPDEAGVSSIAKTYIRVLQDQREGKTNAKLRPAEFCPELGIPIRWDK